MTCWLLVLLLDYDLASSDGGFQASGTLQQWGWAVPAMAPPGARHEPVWSTRPSGNTLNDAEELLTVTLPALVGATRPVLVVEHATELGAGDLGQFELDVGSGFAPVEPIYGYPGGDAFRGSSGGYQVSGVDLTGTPPGSSFRFRFVADASGSGPGWFVRSVRIVDGDPLAPRVSIVTQPADSSDLVGPYTVRVAIEEDFSVERARLFYEVGGIESVVALSPDAGSWRGDIPAQPPDTVVRWRVEVEDCESTTVLEGDPFRVFLPAPLDLSGPTQPHTVARSITLDWEPPPTALPVEGYVLEELGSGATFDSAGTTASVLVDPSWEQVFQVRAVYDGVLGDPSEALTLDVEVPELFEVRPDSVYPGEKVYLSLEGQSLYLLQGASSLSFGTGAPEIEVLDWTVLDVDRARALVEVPLSAEAGPREVVLTGTRGTFRFPERLQVRDAGEAPRITRVEPDQVEQGEQVEIEIHASRPFGTPVEVTLDEELVLGGDPQVDGDKLTISVAALGDARSGAHTLVIDDGTRAYDVEIEVTEYRYQGRRTCSAVGLGPKNLWMGFAVFGLSFIIRLRTRGTWPSHR